MDQPVEAADRTVADSVVGTWRRIGETGPIYQVLGPGTSIIRGGPTMKIQLPESGEILDYALAEILEDRREA